MPRRSLLPPATLPLAAILFLAGGLGSNVLLALFALAALILGCMLLWRPGESPILLFAFVYPWLQASISIFHANWQGTDVAALTEFGGDIHTAILLSIACLLVYAAGMRAGAGPWRWQDAHGLRQQAVSHPFSRWFRLYLAGWATSFVALSFAWVIPGLSQLMLGLASLKWAFFFMLAFAVFVGVRGGKYWLTLVFLIELGSGVGGYFSDFKTVFFVTMFAALASGARFSPRVIIGLVLMGVLVLIFGIVWQTVKPDYRNFVSGGEAAQVVSIDYATRMGKLAELVGALNADRLAEGADQFLRRLTYVEFFGVVLTYVPAQVPHENGAILWDAITRPFTPRILFPDKAVINDSERTNQFTGLGLAGADQGTSISLGWIAEMYIDFGTLGMFPAAFFVGLFYGSIYRRLLRWRASRGLLGMALATAVLIGAGALENSFTKVFGGVVSSLLSTWALAKYMVPRWAPWLAVSRI